MYIKKINLIKIFSYSSKTNLKSRIKPIDKNKAQIKDTSVKSLIKSVSENKNRN